jgi:dihydropteroate synthase
MSEIPNLRELNELKGVKGRHFSLFTFHFSLLFRNFALEMNYTLNLHGRLMDLGEPQVMGILNVTPDSFFAGSRSQTEEEIAVRCNQIVSEGASIIDIGACSTRPGSTPVSESEEMDRLRMALDIVRRELPYSIISVDTFRPDVARMVVEEFGADIINDVGEDKAMYRMVARLGVPYILMSNKATTREILLDFASDVQQLRDFGAKDIILDPGFGFGKTLEQNYEVMSELEKFQVMDLPLLVGISRKSMIYKMFGYTANEALNGTTALNTVALMKGASILRVHDVREAVECVKLFSYL